MQAYVDAGVGWMVYDRPDRHNALSREMIHAVPRIVDAFAADPEVRVVVVRGAGDRSFVSGADIAELGERTGNPADSMLAGSGIAGLLALEKPVVAMINGFCVGGGLLVALCADIRIAAAHAQFGIPAAKLGVAYPSEAVSMLVDLVGPGTASELLLTGERIDATEALRVGLVNRVVESDQLAAVVSDLAVTIAGNATIRSMAGGAGRAEHDAAQQAIRAAWDSEDARIGPTAFFKREAPNFTGR